MSEGATQGRFRQRDFSKPNKFDVITRQADTVEEAFYLLHGCSSARNVPILKEIGHLRMDDPKVLKRLSVNIDSEIKQYFTPLLDYVNKTGALTDVQLVISLFHMVMLSYKVSNEDPDFHADVVECFKGVGYDYDKDYRMLAANPRIDTPRDIRALERLAAKSGYCQYLAKPGFIGGTSFNIIRVRSIEEVQNA